MLQPGILLNNRYRIERELGRGGMGAVYAAIDKTFDSPVALKQNLSANTITCNAFAREARLLRRVRRKDWQTTLPVFPLRPRPIVEPAKTASRRRFLIPLAAAGALAVAGAFGVSQYIFITGRFQANRRATPTTPISARRGRSPRRRLSPA